MDLILDNIAALVTLFGAVAIAAGIFRAEVRKFARRSKRDIAFTMSKSELENVLNRSFEVNYRLAELTEIRINNQWEIRTLRRDLFEQQKLKIRQLSGAMDVKLKTNFSEMLQSDVAFQADREHEQTVMYQQFTNALHVVSTHMRMHLYDVCAETDLTMKDGSDWDAWVRQMRVTLAVEGIDHLRAVYAITNRLSFLSRFFDEALAIMQTFIEHALSFSKAESEIHAGKVKRLQQEIDEAVEAIRSLKERKSLDLVHAFVEEGPEQ